MEEAMNKFLSYAFLVAAMTATAWAQSANWVSSLGVLAQDTTQIRAMMERVEPVDKQFFAERLLRAVKTIPLPQEDKSARFARVAHELVAGAKGLDDKKATLVTIFSKADIKYLGSISDTLAAGLSVERNNISRESFIDIATNVVRGIKEATISDPNSLQRVTITVATFLRAGGGAQELNDPILASVGKGDFADKVRAVAPQVAKGDYEQLSSVAALERGEQPAWLADPLLLPSEPQMHPVGDFAALGRVGGLEGTGFGRTEAIPRPALPYFGQRINSREDQCGCPPSNYDHPHMVIK